eukprot:COSAG06_NODE_52603_length_304_cov_2.526829_1_plen_29_part_10
MGEFEPATLRGAASHVQERFAAGPRGRRL